MKTLKENNEKILNDSKPKTIKNGIACDKCGEELIDSYPNLILTSYPAQKNVHCEKCGFIGYRYV